MFSIQLVSADSYMSKPQPSLDVSYSQFRGSEVNQVPVIRIFGSTSAGEKACLHVHGVFPYLCVPCGEADLEGVVYRLASALDKALNTSLGCSNSTSQHVYNVTPMPAIPLYGYHSTQQQFLKIHLYNPAMVKRSAELLQSGAVLGCVLQPHESHLPYTLQFMIDYNLHGMSAVILEGARLRRPVPAGMADSVQDDVLLPECVLKMSCCALEADVLASGIVNPRTRLEGEAYPGLRAMCQQAQQLTSSLHSAHCSQQRPVSSPATPQLGLYRGLLQRLATLCTQEVSRAEPQGRGVQEGEQCGSAGQSRRSSDMDSDDEQSLLCDLVRLHECGGAEDSNPTSPRRGELECEDDTVWDDSYWDQFAGRIPQLDGAEDDEDCTFDPVICSGKFGRPGGGIRSRESCQLTAENVIDGTFWPEYRGLLEGIPSRRAASPERPILMDDVQFPYGLDLDWEGPEAAPDCTAPAPASYEFAPVDLARSDLADYGPVDPARDYSSALINDVFLSAITDDATQCADVQASHGADWSSDTGCLPCTSESESALDCEDALAEEMLRRAPVRHVASLRICDDRSRVLGTYAGVEKAGSGKQLDRGAPATSNFLMVTHSDGSVDILNAAVGSTVQLSKDRKYVRLLSLPECRGHVALAADCDAFKGTCVELSAGMLGADCFAPARMVVGVDRTTETSPSLLRCSDSALPENSLSFGSTSSSSARRDKSKNIVKFFLKSSLREKPTHSIADHDSRPQQLESADQGNAFHSALVSKSNLEKNSKLLRCTEKSTSGKLSSLSGAFMKKGGVMTGTIQEEGYSKYGAFSSSSRYYEAFGRDVSKCRGADLLEDCFLHRKERSCHKSFAEDMFEGGRTRDLHLEVSQASSEEDKSLVKLESSPGCSSRASPEDHRQCTCYITSQQARHQRHASASKERYDPYEFSDEVDELLSSASPPIWPRRSSQSVAKSALPGPPRGGKPASYLRQGEAAHRVNFRITCAASASPRSGEGKAADVSCSQQTKCSAHTATAVHCSSQPASTSSTDSVLENIKTEPVWEEEVTVTSIPKLTLLRSGDTYINFVRLDEDDGCRAPKRELMDEAAQLAAVKKEEQVGTSSEYCSANCGDRAETKNVVSNVAYAPSRSGKLHYELVDFLADGMDDAGSNSVVEVIDLSPSSDGGASVEVVETWRIEEESPEPSDCLASDDSQQVAAVVLAGLLDDVVSREISPALVCPLHVPGAEPASLSSGTDVPDVCRESSVSAICDGGSRPARPTGLGIRDERVSKFGTKIHSLHGRKVRRSTKVSKLTMTREKNMIFLVKKMNGKEMTSDRFCVGSHVKRRMLNQQRKEKTCRNVYVGSRCAMKGLHKRQGRLLRSAASKVVPRSAVHKAVGDTNIELLCNVAKVVPNTAGVCGGNMACSVAKAVDCCTVVEGLAYSVHLEEPQADGLSCSSSVVSTNTVEVRAGGAASRVAAPAKSLRKRRRKTEKFEATVEVGDMTDPILVTSSVNESSGGPDALPPTSSTAARRREAESSMTDERAVPSAGMALPVEVADVQEPSSAAFLPMSEQRPARIGRSRVEGRKNKEEGVHVTCSERTRKCVPPAQLNEATRKHGCKMLSVSLSKNLPKCRDDSNLARHSSLKENISLKMFSGKSPQTFSKQTNIRKTPFTNKTGRPATTDNESLLNLSHPVAWRTDKQLDDVRRKESKCTTGRKVKGPPGEARKVSKLKKGSKCSGEEKVCSKSKWKASPRSVKTSVRDASVGCRSGHEPLTCTLSASLRKPRKRSCSSTLRTSRLAKRTRLSTRHNAKSEGLSCAANVDVARRPVKGKRASVTCASNHPDTSVGAGESSSYVPSRRLGAHTPVSPRHSSVSRHNTTRGTFDKCKVKGKTSKMGGRDARRKASVDDCRCRTLRSAKVVPETRQEVKPRCVGRPRKVHVAGDQSVGKAVRAPQRNFACAKKLRSCAHKQACEGGTEPRTSVPEEARRPCRKPKIPCVDGASGSSSSEDESAVPTKRQKCSPARRARLPVQIVRSPRRLELRGRASSSPDLVPDTPPGQCLTSVEVTRGLPGSSHNLSVKSGAAEMGMVNTAQRLFVPSRTESEEKPKIVHFNNKVFLFPSACDNLQDGERKTVCATNHRCVKKKLKFSVGDQQHKHPRGDQQIKILRRSSLDIFTDSSSSSGDTNERATGASHACHLEVRNSRSITEIEKCSQLVGASREDERSAGILEDKDGDEGIVSFYETTLPSPPEPGCSHDSPASSAGPPASPPQSRPLAEPFYSDPRDVTGPVHVGGRPAYLRCVPDDERQERSGLAVASPLPEPGRAATRFLVPVSPGHEGSEEELLLSQDSLVSATSPAVIAHSTPLPVAAGASVDERTASQVWIQSKEVACGSGQPHHRVECSAVAGSLCQVAGVTPDNSHHFLLSLHNMQDALTTAQLPTQAHMLTLLCVELHVNTRGDLRPDPLVDPVQAVFYCVHQAEPLQPTQQSGVLVVDAAPTFGTLPGTGLCGKVEWLHDELALLAALEHLVASWDPDILAGYEVEMLSWGYLFQRGSALGLNLCAGVSRVPSCTRDSHVASGQDKASRETRVAGRILLDVWRLMRHQVALQSYSYESVLYQVLHQRRPHHSFRTLTSWWSRPGTPAHRWLVVEHYMERARGTLRLLEQLDVLGTTSELARLFGIQFEEVLTRGSQFRVESMMLRLARMGNYVALSPSVKQRAAMRAPEFLQLIMEPESRFYCEPVVVLDFQSLYPSIMIAYNYCYSTCLGHVEALPQASSFKFGCSELHVPTEVLESVLEHMTISPCGVGFVGAATRVGVLPCMLQHILRTRLMVKKVMKDHPDDKPLLRVLHARQLGLKLIANVTYGYTAANFSGRMPCVEVADSVVSKGRETLERAIQLVENNHQWNARVVYGDTDSMFVMLAGRTRHQAFAIGAEIAEAVTLDNPSPVKLKLEKVYQPCILQTKKRYVGYAYESPDQVQPKYDAKGIETVRRDGCPAVAKILEKSLRVLFDSRDVSLVKRYVCRQWDKIVQGRANIQDLVFAKEYRGRAGYKPGACVPALHLARRWLETDPRAEPRVGERVPYVVVNGPPSVPLISLVRSPQELLEDPSLRINAVYYITRCIVPALRRCFSLLGADVDAWYADMPRKVAPSLPLVAIKPSKRSTISQYFGTVKCAVCNEPTHDGLCPDCLQQPVKVAAVLADKLLLWERTFDNITQVCRSCCGRYEPLNCCSIDCPVLFRRSQAQRDLLQETYVRDLLSRHLSSRW